MAQYPEHLRDYTLHNSKLECKGTTWQPSASTGGFTLHPMGDECDCILFDFTLTERRKITLWSALPGEAAPPHTDELEFEITGWTGVSGRWFITPTGTLTCSDPSAHGAPFRTDARHGALWSKGKKRKERDLTPELVSDIWAEVDKILQEGKRPDTLKAYASAVNHWLHVAESQNWSPFLDAPLTRAEGQRRMLLFLGYERFCHKLKASSLRSKISALRWFHVTNYRNVPFDDFDLVQDWLRGLAKKDGPAVPKIPVPISLLTAIMTLLLAEKPEDWAPTFAALPFGLFYLCRSIDYLADGEGRADIRQVVTWGRLRFTGLDADDKRHLVTLSELISALAKYESVLMTVTLYSHKNWLKTCTRTVRSTKGAPTCVVHAIATLLQAHLERTGNLPSENAAVFQLANGKVLSRTHISDVLKAGADAAGIPGALVSTHSLRRGGCSMYLASGATPQSVMRFGRWLSTSSFERYVFPGEAALMEAQQKAHFTAPYFEMH